MRPVLLPVAIQSNRSAYFDPFGVLGNRNRTSGNTVGYPTAPKTPVSMQEHEWRLIPILGSPQEASRHELKRIIAVEGS